MPEVTVVPANEASWEDLQAVLGTSGYDRSIFADAGFDEVGHPTLRRVVMRIEF